MSSRKINLWRRGVNTMVIRMGEDDVMIDYLLFEETEEGVVYRDTSGYDIPLDRISIESPNGTYLLSTVRKNNLTKKLLKILAETDNYYIVRR